MPVSFELPYCYIALSPFILTELSVQQIALNTLFNLVLRKSLLKASELTKISVLFLSYIKLVSYCTFISAAHHSFYFLIWKKFRFQKNNKNTFFIWATISNVLNIYSLIECFNENLFKFVSCSRLFQIENYTHWHGCFTLLWNNW
jgi:hypothetical protein